MQIEFRELVVPTPKIAMRLNDWANDREIVHLMRPSFSKEELDAETSVTVGTMLKRIGHGHVIYLIYADEQLVGEASYVVDPPQLLRHKKGSAWIGITIGEASARGKGIGTLAMQHLEDEIRAAGCKRIELGVFEYNAPAIRLYKKMGYKKIGHIREFTYWDGKMWTDIRMEKRLK
mgnify:CR=1 FL=1